MTIQFNTDKTIDWDERHNDHFTAIVKEELDRFSTHITRVEVHLSDENGSKDGVNDIRCLLEVRIEGRQPIATSDQSDTIEQSMSGAIIKMQASLKTILERKNK
ncbi:MAG: HPF/RaiA family ribosome-associated protein [Crocinitomicaceae bacterium]|nr:HPF/RaiA family ribosome-associated protein [Crocinitomicaceae bacterium]